MKLHGQLSEAKKRIMREFDQFLLDYIKPLMPQYQELIGWAVCDADTLRIWYFDKNSKKAAILVPAP